jgi:catechol 2,3-dioxygenase-like lactoylglutathione lyase family enzyme
VERSRRFFEAAFGWRPIERPANIRGKAAWLEIAPGQELHLLEVAEFEPSRFEREFGRHIALSQPAAGLEGLKERLAAAGAVLIAPERETPYTRFFFRDPNGYVFEVVEEEAAA